MMIDDDHDDDDDDDKDDDDDDDDGDDMMLLIYCLKVVGAQRGSVLNLKAFCCVLHEFGAVLLRSALIRNRFANKNAPTLMQNAAKRRHIKAERIKMEQN